MKALLVTLFLGVSTARNLQGLDVLKEGKSLRAGSDKAQAKSEKVVEKAGKADKVSIPGGPTIMNSMPYNFNDPFINPNALMQGGPWLDYRYGDPSLLGLNYNNNNNNNNGSGESDEDDKDDDANNNSNNDTPVYGPAPHPGLYRGADYLYSPVPPPPSFPYGAYGMGGSFNKNGLYAQNFPYAGGVMNPLVQENYYKYPFLNGNNIPPMMDPRYGPQNLNNMIYNPSMYNMNRGVPPPGSPGGITGLMDPRYRYPSGFYSPWGVPPLDDSAPSTAVPTTAAIAFKEQAASIFAPVEMKEAGSSNLIETAETPLMTKERLPNGMEINVPLDHVNTMNGDISLFQPKANLNGEVYNPILSTAMNDAAMQTAQSLNNAESFYDAHRKIADEQATAATKLEQYQMLNLHHEAIIDDLTRSIDHLNGELEKTKNEKLENEGRMDKLARQIKALELDKKKIDTEYELKKFTDKYGDISSKEDIEKKLKSLKQTIDATNQDMLNVLQDSPVVATTSAPLAPSSSAAASTY